jgi:hypothetical protein
MQRWVNLGESLLAVPRPATADVSRMAHPAIQILPPLKTESKSADALVSIFVLAAGGLAPEGHVAGSVGPCGPHSGMLRAVTWAASTKKKRNIELPCFVMCPSRRRFPLESSKGTSPR